MSQGEGMHPIEWNTAVTSEHCPLAGQQDKRNLLPCMRHAQEMLRALGLWCGAQNQAGPSCPRELKNVRPWGQPSPT